MVKILALAISVLFHPVHVSLTSIDYVPDTDSVKVFVRMYYDDFLLDYKMFDKNADLKYLSDSKSFPAEMMGKYLSEKVIILADNKQLEGKLLNLVLVARDNEISANLYFRTVVRPESIAVRNGIMTGLYDDQANMTIIRAGSFEEGVKLTPEKAEQIFIIR
jgi:hypothetical protein